MQVDRTCHQTHALRSARAWCRVQLEPNAATTVPIELDGAIVGGITAAPERIVVEGRRANHEAQSTGSDADRERQATGRGGQHVAARCGVSPRRRLNPRSLTSPLIVCHELDRQLAKLADEFLGDDPLLRLADDRPERRMSANYRGTGSARNTLVAPSA